DGALETIADSGIEVVADLSANSDRAEGRSVMADILQANPEVSVVFAANDDMALGALEAIKSAGVDLEDILVIGVDGTSDAVDSMLAGELDASIAQNSYDMGRTSVELAVELLEGGTIEERVDTGVTVVTQENAEEYGSQLEEQAADEDVAGCAAARRGRGARRHGRRARARAERARPRRAGGRGARRRRAPGRGGGGVREGPGGRQRRAARRGRGRRRRGRRLAGPHARAAHPRLPRGRQARAVREAAGRQRGGDGAGRGGGGGGRAAAGHRGLHAPLRPRLPRAAGGRARWPGRRAGARPLRPPQRLPAPGRDDRGRRGELDGPRARHPPVAHRAAGDGHRGALPAVGGAARAAARRRRARTGAR